MRELIRSSIQLRVAQAVVAVLQRYRVGSQLRLRLHALVNAALLRLPFPLDLPDVGRIVDFASPPLA